MTYNWQQEDWSIFPYGLLGVEAPLLEFIHLAGQVDGILKACPKADKTKP